jgi:hypothetical protein
MKRFLKESILLSVMSIPALGASPEGAEPIPRRTQISGPTIDIRIDCGARGDGISNDTDAFRKAAALIQKAKSAKLVLPTGIYIVGTQYHEHGQYPYYKNKPIFELSGVDGVIIEGSPGTIIRLADGLRFGSFDKDTGERFDPVMAEAFKNGLFVDKRYAAYPGNVLAISNSKNVTLCDFELDGNSRKLVLGGTYGDTGRQLPASGLALQGNSNVWIENIVAHHHGTDGIMIGYPLMKATDAPAPHVLINITSEYNARQGLSWVGGKGLTVTNSKFNHTGRATFMSAPGAGVDIEAEESVCRDGMFTDCEFVNNAGCGIVADSGDGGYTTFKKCTIWGTTTWAMWNKKPGMRFEECNFYGSVVHAYGCKDTPALATHYSRCHFEDKEHPKHGVYRANMVVTHDGNADNVLFDNCDIVANKVKGVWLKGDAILRNCRITHKDTQLNDLDFQSLFRECQIENTRFSEEFPIGFTKRYLIIAEQVKRTNVVVQGPVVKWKDL